MGAANPQEAPHTQMFGVSWGRHWLYSGLQEGKRLGEPGGLPVKPSGCHTLQSDPFLLAAEEQHGFLRNSKSSPDGSFRKTPKEKPRKKGAGPAPGCGKWFQDFSALISGRRTGDLPSPVVQETTATVAQRTKTAEGNSEAVWRHRSWGLRGHPGGAAATIAWGRTENRTGGQRQRGQEPSCQVGERDAKGKEESRRQGLNFQNIWSW